MIPGFVKFITIVALWLAGLGAAAQFAKLAVPFSLLQQAYPDAGSELGWLLSVVSLVGVFLGIVVGGVVGQIGERKTLIAGLLIGGAMSLLQAQMPGFSAMLASRFVEGFSHLVIVVAAPTLIAQIAPVRMLGLVMALWSTFFSVAFAFVAWVGMPFIANGRLEVLVSWHGWYMFAMAVLVVLLVPKASSRRPGQATAPQNIFGLHVRTYASPHITAAGVGWLFYALTFVSILALLPRLSGTADTQWIGGLLPLLSIAVSLLIVPALNRRLAGFKIVIMGFALAAAFILIHLALGLGLALPILLFIAFGLVQGASFGSVPELNHTSSDQALAYGFMAQTGNIGNLLGTPILLFVLNSAGADAAYLAIALFYAMAVAAHLLLWRSRRASDASLR